MSKDRLRDTHILMSGEAKKQLQEISQWSQAPSGMSSLLRLLIRKYHELLRCQMEDGLSMQLVPKPSAAGEPACPVKMVDLKL